MRCQYKGWIEQDFGRSALSGGYIDSSLPVVAVDGFLLEARDEQWEERLQPYRCQRIVGDDVFVACAEKLDADESKSSPAGRLGTYEKNDSHKHAGPVLSR